MDPIARDWYVTKFQLHFQSKQGNEFQGFFEDIMELRFPNDFVRVRPWGNVGDRKNDGYLKSKRTIFAVYAPVNIELAKTIRKIKSDFNGALPFWKDYFEAWIYVHNDIQGLPPNVLKILLDLEKKNPPIKVTHWGFAELRALVLDLGESDLVILFGYAPTNKIFRQVGFTELKLVLDYIAEKPTVPDQQLRPPPPDKLDKNALSDHVANLLRAGMTKSHEVRNFMRQYHDPTYGDKIATAFKMEYLALKGRDLIPDEIFMGLMKFAGGEKRGSAKHEASILAILAFLFEECDIFEG